MEWRITWLTRNFHLSLCKLKLTKIIFFTPDWTKQKKTSLSFFLDVWSNLKLCKLNLTWCKLYFAYCLQRIAYLVYIPDYYMILHIVFPMFVDFFSKSSRMTAVALFLLMLFFSLEMCVAGDRRNTVDLLGFNLYIENLPLKGNYLIILMIYFQTIYK